MNGLVHEPHFDDHSRRASEDVHLSTDPSAFPDTNSVSDTVTSRAEDSAAEDGKGQEQSNATKKQTSFKPVTFTKSRGSTAKAPGASPGAQATPSKGTYQAPGSSAPTPLQGSRPRLVAKSTSGLGASAKLKANVKNGAPPDPMQVWNKNRITPQPSTKHLTDEELKQQYGIHMTSRIQGDGEGKEAKWADIDDDEDDWAPETIEWGDGTKISVGQATPAPTPAQERPESTRPDTNRLTPPAKTISQDARSLGPNATVLRLGQSAQQQQAQKPAMVPKGPLEKTPQLTTKAPAAPPSKSPWAALPPVEKVSPVVISPQMSMPPPQRPFGNQNYMQSPSNMAGPSPAREMSADDFNRSWRDSNQPRELYNSTSGKYEAVQDRQRRASKNEMGFRAPAVLQRPSQSDPHAPAEPSAAFQTHRTSMDGERGTWQRRRASSNLSATSGPLGRRMSLTRSGDFVGLPNEVLQERRQSQATRSESVASQDIPVPPSAAYRAQGYSPIQQIPRQQPSSGDCAVPMPGTDMQAELERQKQMMKEKREAAIKRKQDEDAQLEAEKQERIRVRLETLDAEAKAKAKDVALVVEAIAPSALETAAAMPKSPPKPSFPDAAGVPTQYGMMKLHPPEASKKPSPPVEPRSETSLTAPQTAISAKASPALINGARPVPDIRQPEDNTLAGGKGSSLAPDARAPWSSRNDHRSPPNGNLWGHPTNNKTLGNGTFDQSLASFPTREMGTRDASWTNGRPAMSEASPRLASTVNHQIPMDRTPSAPFYPSVDQAPLATNSEVDSLLPQTRPAPIGPPHSQNTGQRWQQSSAIRPSTSGISGWNDFPIVAAREDRAESELLQRERALRMEEEARTGVRKAPQYTFNETWKQIEVGDEVGKRHVTAVVQSNMDPSLVPGSRYGAVGSLPGADARSSAGPGMPLRSSRFFPPSSNGVSAQEKRAVTYTHPATPRSASPPPAEEYGSPHPVFVRDMYRPVVHLPQEKPVVKLPVMAPIAPVPSPPPSPVKSATPPVPLSWAAAVRSQPPPPPMPQPLPAPQPVLRTVSQPIASTTSWQDRFNGLLGTKGPKMASPEIGTQVLAVSSSTRELLEVPPPTVMASVSLPQSDDKDAGKATSKDVEDEEMMFEDREPGSLPIVRAPQVPDFPGYRAVIIPQSKLAEAKRVGSISSTTVTPLMLEDHDGYLAIRKPRTAFIQLPGMAKAVRKELPLKGNSSNASRKTSRNTSGIFSKKNGKGGQKSREVSAAVQQPLQDNMSSPSLPQLPNGQPRAPQMVAGNGPSPRHNGPQRTNWHKPPRHQAQAGMAH